MQKLIAVVATVATSAIVSIAGTGVAHADRVTASSMSVSAADVACESAPQAGSDVHVVKVAKPLPIGGEKVGFQLYQPMKLKVVKTGKSLCVKVANDKADLTSFDYEITLNVGSIHGNVGFGQISTYGESTLNRWVEYPMAKADSYDVQAQVSATYAGSKDKIIKVISPQVKLS